MSGLYDEDILIWSEQQAALLRRLASGERVNSEIDWENVAEEVESADTTNRVPWNRCWSRRSSTC